MLTANDIQKTKEMLPIGARFASIHSNVVWEVTAICGEKFTYQEVGELKMNFYDLDFVPCQKIGRVVTQHFSQVSSTSIAVLSITDGKARYKIVAEVNTKIIRVILETYGIKKSAEALLKRFYKEQEPMDRLQAVASKYSYISYQEKAMRCELEDILMEMGIIEGTGAKYYHI
jgi:predicted DNA binding protein